MTNDGKWIRLFPVPYRFLDEDKRFSKYQWIDVDVIKASSDPRPESYKLNADSISIIDSVPSSDGWAQRKAIIRPLIKTSLCEIRKSREDAGFPTLGIFKPYKINKLIIETADSEWSAQQLMTLQQTELFHQNPTQPLEKIPFNFKYEFSCSCEGCNGHTLTCTDWEMGQSFRRWRKQYGDNWEAAFRLKYEQEMKSKFDTHFYVGTIHQYPNAWIIIGLYYPPVQVMSDLFDSLV